MIAPVDGGGIYYSGPSEDWSRPGRMWWSVPAGIDTFSTWKEVTTVYHGVPRPPPADRAGRDRAGEPEPLAAADVLGLGPRRGLGPLLRTAHGRARIPGRPGGAPGDARRLPPGGSQGFFRDLIFRGLSPPLLPALATSQTYGYSGEGKHRFRREAERHSGAKVNSSRSEATLA